MYIQYVYIYIYMCVYIYTYICVCAVYCIPCLFKGVTSEVSTLPSLLSSFHRLGFRRRQGPILSHSRFGLSAESFLGRTQVIAGAVAPSSPEDLVTAAEQPKKYPWPKACCEYDLEISEKILFLFFLHFLPYYALTVIVTNTSRE